MRPRILAVVALVVAFAAGTGHAQPPSAPAPRAVSTPPEIDNLTFRYTLPKAAAASLPDLEIAVVGSRAEVRSTEGVTMYNLTAPRVLVRGGVISAIGSQADAAELRSTSLRGAGNGLYVVRGGRIVVDVSSGTIRVENSVGGLATPMGR